MSGGVWLGGKVARINGLLKSNILHTYVLYVFCIFIETSAVIMQ